MRRYISNGLTELCRKAYTIRCNMIRYGIFTCAQNVFTFVLLIMNCVRYLLIMRRKNGQHC